MEIIPLRKSEIKGSAIMFGNVAFSLLNLGVGMLMAETVTYHFVVPVVNNLLFVCLAVAIRRGHHWAKLLFLLLFSVAVVLTLFHLDQQAALFREHPWNGLAQAIYFTLNAWALAVLFRKPRPRAIR